MLKIERFQFNVFSENTYVIWDEESLEAAVIDPGCSTENEDNILGEFIKTHGLSLKYIINTHVHIDHITGNAFLKEHYGARLLCAEADVFLFEIMQREAAGFGMKVKPSPLPDEFLTGDRPLYLGGIRLDVILTPGHSPGGVCIYIKQSSVCFTGDLLFRESIGRTDLWGGDYDELLTSIEDKIFSLPDDVTIYPGHGGLSTIGYEKTSNPFLT